MAANLYDWKEYALADVINLINGGTPKTGNPEYWNGDIPWLSIADFNNDFRHVYYTEKSISQAGLENSSTKILKKGQLIISTRGTVGAIAQLGRDMAFNQSCYGIDGEPGLIINDFLYYLIKFSVGKLQQITHGAVFDTITKDTFKYIVVRLPQLEEQKAIAHILGTLDDKIELNQQMNRNLEAIAQTIFKSWFIDFDPVRAKMEGRQPAGMDAAIAALFPDSFEDSPLGEIPKRWRVVSLPEAIEVNPRRSLPKEEIAPYLDMQNMPVQGHRPNAWIDRPFGSGTKFMNGDTLLARITPCLENGKTAFVDFLEDRQVGWGSTEYIIFRPKPPLPLEYGYYLARSEELRAYAIQNMTGSSGRQRVPVECFQQYPIVIPQDAIARCFGDFTKPLMATIKANSEQSLTLATIRNTLLPKLMSGEIRVKEAEKILEDVA